MKVAFVADSHDNIHAIQRAVELFERVHVQAVIHAGDCIAPFALKPFINHSWDFYAVYGNNDGEREGLKHVGVDITDGPRTVRIGEIVFGIVHNRADWDNQPCDVLVFGHLHKCSYNKKGTLLEINPGELGGWLTGKSTAAIYDSEICDAEILEI